MVFFGGKIFHIILCKNYIFFSNIGSLLKVGSVAEQLKKNSPERYPLQLLVWILGQLAGIGKIHDLFNLIFYRSFRINNVEM